LINLLRDLEDFKGRVAVADVLLNSKGYSEEPAVYFEFSDELVSNGSKSCSSKLMHRLAVKHSFIAKKTRIRSCISIIRSTAWSVSGAFIRFAAL
jgi:GTP-sensing pleiotropic transcriptional regulator CodY